MTAGEIKQRNSTRARLADAVQRFTSNRSGVTAIEYGLMLAFIGAALVAGLSVMGGPLVGVFTSLATILGS